MENTMNKHTNPIPAFNTEVHLKEINERFGRLIKNLGSNNRKGTERYNFEVNFTYAIREIEQSPAYMQGKMFDKATGIVGRLIAMLKTQNEISVDTPATEQV
jgi:hypothetical protein